jgi:segregation and condensation protein B
MSEQDSAPLHKIVEGLIFAADEPITPVQIRELIEGDIPESGVTPMAVKAIVDELNDEYSRGGKPYRILALAGGYQFATNREVSAYVSKLHREQARKRLTQAALETLSIIAYKQPVTKADLETIRGVNCDYIIRSLLEKDLITVTGREHAPGRPLLYGTTKRFLQHFGLSSLSELPKPREIEELIGETELEVEKRLIEMERLRQESEEDGQQKRERKPHPISQGAVAKIIPLNPDYRPGKNVSVPKAEEEIEKTPEETISAAGADEISPEAENGPREVTILTEQQVGEDSTPETDEMRGEEPPSDQKVGEVTITTEPESPTPIAEIPEEVEEPLETPAEEPLRFPESVGAADIKEENLVHDEIGESDGSRQYDGTGMPRKGWKKWKNKIVQFIKKIFG